MVQSGIGVPPAEEAPAEAESRIACAWPRACSLPGRAVAGGGRAPLGELVLEHQLEDRRHRGWWETRADQPLTWSAFRTGTRLRTVTAWPSPALATGCGGSRAARCFPGLTVIRVRIGRWFGWCSGRSGSWLVWVSPWWGSASGGSGSGRGAGSKPPGFSCAAAVLMGPSGVRPVIAGWVVAEAGRQPYVIYGVLRTADASHPWGPGRSRPP